MEIKTGGRNCGKMAALKEKYGELKPPAKSEKLLGRNLDVTWLIDPWAFYEAFKGGDAK